MMQKFAPPSCYTMLMVSALGLIIYNEYLEFYLLKQNQWTRARESVLHPTKSAPPDGKEPLQTQQDPVRILFVGDPQIQGYKDEPAILGYITRYEPSHGIIGKGLLTLSFAVGCYPAGTS